MEPDILTEVDRGHAPMMSPAVPDNGPLDVIESQLRECFGRAVYSHKTHEKAADMAIARLSRIKILQIILSALTTGGLLAVLAGPADMSQIAAVISALLSTALLALNAYTKENDLGRISQEHKDTADELWSVRESYLSLLTDIRTQSLSLSAIRDRRDALQGSLAGVYTSAPRTFASAYKRAQRALKLNEDLTFADAEIDQFLPAPLRRGR